MNLVEIVKNGIMGIFDFLREVIEGTTKPINSFLAVSLPLVAAFAMAMLTGGNLVKYMDMDTREAKIYAFLFEGLAIFVFTQLVTSIVSWIKSRNPKTRFLVFILSALAIMYMIIIIAINVSLQSSNGVKGIDIFVYFLLSLMTPITGTMYGYYLLVTKDNQEHVEIKESEKEKQLRIENDKKEKELRHEAERNRRWDEKHGIKSSTSQVYNLDENFPKVQEKQKFGSDYRDKVLDMLDEVWNKEKRILSPSEITERLNKKYKTNFVNGNVKGFWSRTTSDWKKEKGIN